MRWPARCKELNLEVPLGLNMPELINSNESSKSCGELGGKFAGMPLLPLASAGNNAAMEIKALLR